ncbi:MAG: aromatic-ring-hydroxylating dioxygenase subunit beta [Immundisolibacter sp.]|uniref:aromatic-ring-hydroxylating dioxygenase subunit beta n=1 Tax=Immundisolibacter sp. TaxID=1934948 RepID=UPI003EE3E305
MTAAPDQAAVEHFLYEEAKLLDERRYEDWVQLFTEDGVYWVPSGHDGPAGHSVALIYDTTPRLRERLTRMGSRAFWAQQPPTHTTRLVGNVLVQPGAEHADEIEVECRFILALLRRHRQALLSGVARYRLQPYDGSFRICQKVVTLQERDESFDNLTFLL